LALFFVDILYLLIFTMSSLLACHNAIGISSVTEMERMTSACKQPPSGGDANDAFRRPHDLL